VVWDCVKTDLGRRRFRSFSGSSVWDPREMEEVCLAATACLVHLAFQRNHHDPLRTDIPSSPPTSQLMAVLMSHHNTITKCLKRRRRTATAVLAGEFDPRPTRFVLTALLNGVPPNQSVESEEKTKRDKKKEKRERDRERKRQKAAAAREMRERLGGEASTSSTSAAMATAPTKISISLPVAQSMPTASSFWRARPAIHIASMQRSVSITPPPMPSSPVSTPGPSTSSSTSRTSSKRPYTPDDEEEIDQKPVLLLRPKEPPKKRIAVKKGWKGWVEGSPPPSEKLINLDSVPVLQERKTRSGKAFDAIGEGKDWI
jgi:hypothetical protein